MQNKVEYIVETEEEHRLIFDKRKDAEAYKSTLLKSQEQIKSIIIRQEYDGDYILSKEKVK